LTTSPDRSPIPFGMAPRSTITCLPHEVKSMRSSGGSRPRWTRGEVLQMLALHCVTAFGRFHSRNPDIIELARELDRTPSWIAMKPSNLASLDPSGRVRGIAGLADHGNR
jgi:hypothetical protein